MENLLTESNHAGFAVGHGSDFGGEVAVTMLSDAVAILYNHEGLICDKLETPSKNFCICEQNNRSRRQRMATDCSYYHYFHSERRVLLCASIIWLIRHQGGKST